MKLHLQHVVPICLALAAATAPAQFYRLKGASVAASGTGQFSTVLTSSPTTGPSQIPTPNGGFLNETVSGQQQSTEPSAGLLATLGFHPVAFAGIELNYGFTQYSEQYSFNYSSATTTQQLNIPVAMHEFTGAYQFHPPHLKFQPFVNIGGGYIDFLPQFANNQWRGAGLIEAGLDIPTRISHVAIRVQGRALIYRAPNFDNAGISTRSWRVTEEPSAGLVYRF